MKKLLGFLLVISVLIGAIIAFKTPYSPCYTPVKYKIGKIDEEFKLTQNDAIKYVNEATEIWSKDYGKKLFTYDQSAGVLTIDFLYDERSALEDKIINQKNDVDKENISLEAKIKNYEADVISFEKRLAAFNDKVQRYNNQGGAPTDIYNELIAEQSRLRKEADLLNEMAKKLNLATSSYNSQVSNLNQNVFQFNQALIEKPEEGVYDSEENKIIVYFVNNKSELIHTMAHELGHSIGMDHVEDKKAIMYPYSTKEIALTPGDKDELEKVCQPYPLLIHWQKLVALRIYESLADKS